MNIIPLRKKSDVRACNSYRSITILSVVLKVYEMILEKRLRKTLEWQLEESQSGFRKGQSIQGYVFTDDVVIFVKIEENVHHNMVLWYDAQAKRNKKMYINKESYTNRSK